MLRIVFLGIDPSGLPFSLCSNVIPNGLLTKSLSKVNFVCFWLFCSSSVYESKLSTQPRNKKASHFVRGFVATLGSSLDEFAEDFRAILDAKIKNLYACNNSV
jgi:hypothetical protein